MAKSKCAQNYFYDGLVEKCKPCYLRCSKPPISCTPYCIKPAVRSTSSTTSVSENSNLWLILLFLLLCAVTALMLLIPLLRKRQCQAFLKDKGGNRGQGEDPGHDKDLVASKETGMTQDRTLVNEEFQHNSDTLCNSSLPLPSTEEGATILVTTKTAQTCSYARYCTQDKSLDVYRSVSLV